MNEKEKLLPWHINETLSTGERQTVEDWLMRDEKAAAAQAITRQVAEAVTAQGISRPSAQVEKRLISQIHKPARVIKSGNQWIWGFPVAVFIFALLWWLIQPGILLQWSAAGNDLAAFRIYRAPAGSSSFTLITEVPAAADQDNYKYADSTSIPGITYQYIIEVIGQNGEIAASPAVPGNAIGTLSALFAILLTSYMLTFGMITIVREIKSPLQSYLVN